MSRQLLWCAGLVSALAITTTAIAFEARAADNADQIIGETNGGIRIMPLGDSITDGFQLPGGYRIILWNRLADDGHVVDFVGSLANGPVPLADHDHEGHSGWRIDEVSSEIDGWLEQSTPSVVLLQLGTNDIIQDWDVANAPTRLSDLILQITTQLPGVSVLVATLTPLADQTANAKVMEFNAALPTVVETVSRSGALVYLVDMYSAVETYQLADGVHPNVYGYWAMATEWYEALTSSPGCLV